MGSRSKQFAPQFPSSVGGPGDLPSSAFQFDWRQDPSLPRIRAEVRKIIFRFLAQHTSQAFVQDSVAEIDEFSVALENQLFDEAVSKDLYLNRQSFIPRLERLIRHNWLHQISVQERFNRTGSRLVRSTVAAVPSQAQCDSGREGLFNSSDYLLSRSISSRIRKLSADDVNQPHSFAKFVSSSGLQGNDFKLRASVSNVGRKSACDNISLSAERPIPGIYAPGNAPSHFHALDNRYTFPANAPKLHSKSSLGSFSEQLQISDGNPGFSVVSEKNCPLLHAQYNSKLETADVLNVLPTTVSSTCDTSGEVHISELVNSQSDSHYNKFLDAEGQSCGGSAVNHSNLLVVQTSPHFIQGVQSQHLMNDILDLYVKTNRRHKAAGEGTIPFIERLHSRWCNDGKCNCEQYKLLLNHIDNCQTSLQPLCGPALMPISRYESSCDPSISSSRSRGRKRDGHCTAKASPIMDKRCRMDISSSKTSSDHRASPVVGHTLSPDGPLNMSQSSGSFASSNSEATELKLEVDTVHENQSAGSSGLRKDAIDQMPLGPRSEEACNVSEEYSVDCGKVEMDPSIILAVASSNSEATELMMEVATVPANQSASSSGLRKDSIDQLLGPKSEEACNVSEDHSVDHRKVEVEPSSILVSASSNSEATALKMEVSTVHEQWSASSDASRKDALDHLLKHKSEEACDISEELSVDCGKVEMEPTSTRVGEVQVGVNLCTDNSKSVPILAECHHIAQKEDVLIQVVCDETIPETNARHVADFIEEQQIAENEEIMCVVKSGAAVPETNADHVADLIVCSTQIKSEKQKMSGVSLTEFFTSDEVEQHQQSLRSPDQTAAEELSGKIISGSGSENTCQLCYLDRLAFPPMPIYCFSCDLRIKNHATYYSMVDENGAQPCICSKCYSKSRGGHIKMLQLSIPKSKLVAKQNDVVTVESWVQCDKCEKWQHQICALFIDKKDIEGQAEYTCPKCYLEELRRGDCIPLSRTAGFGASNLPGTKLSDHIENWLFSHLKKEREERAKAVGKGLDEVPGAADLVVRVVSSVDKELKVKQQFLDTLSAKNYPVEFPYRSKVILLFQMIDGVDVCLFAMYVQEFGSQCSPPNRRSINIAYLDSVKYFRPEIKTVNGEALRTFVYHQILNGYLDYCKKRGFAICYIWACPPSKGEDYILYCHPQTQKTPQRDKLNLWYRSMLKKATSQNVAVHFTSLWDSIFASDAESKIKITAAQLPYDGDYLSAIIEGIIRRIEENSGGVLQKKFQQIPKRSLRALGYTNPSADDAKDILLMHQLYSTIESKDQFFKVYLQYVCKSCNEVILSGIRWSCNNCKNYQLCEGCYQGEAHTTSNGQKHKLHQKLMDKLPLDTEDNDAILDNCFLENRHTFLSFCQGNNYQFDTLRRAKHSSTMILYNLHNAFRGSIRSSCSLCLTSMEVGPRWICRMCPEFNVCAACYKKNGSSSHTHNLIYHSPAVDQRTEDPNAEKVVQEKRPEDIVHHAFRCNAGDRCARNPNCRALKMLIAHTRVCKTRRLSGDCQNCRKVVGILVKHARICTVSNCGVPRCKYVQLPKLYLLYLSEELWTCSGIHLFGSAGNLKIETGIRLLTRSQE